MKRLFILTTVLLLAAGCTTPPPAAPLAITQAPGSKPAASNPRTRAAETPATGSICGMVLRRAAPGREQLGFSAKIEVYTTSNKLFTSTASDTTGAYRIEDVPGGAYTLRETHTGATILVNVKPGTCAKGDIIVDTPLKPPAAHKKPL